MTTPASDVPTVLATARTATRLALGSDASSLHTRGLVIIGFVVVMFALAGLAVYVGKRRVRSHTAKAFAPGSKEQNSQDWLADLHADRD